MRIRDTIFQISEKPHIKRNHHFQTFPNYVQFWKQNLEPQLQLTVYVHLKNHLVGVNHRLKARMQLFVAPKNDKNTQRIGYTVCVYIYIIAVYQTLNPWKILQKCLLKSESSQPPIFSLSNLRPLMPHGIVAGPLPQ